MRGLSGGGWSRKHSCLVYYFSGQLLLTRDTLLENQKPRLHRVIATGRNQAGCAHGGFQRQQGLNHCRQARGKHPADRITTPSRANKTEGTGRPCTGLQGRPDRPSARTVTTQISLRSSPQWFRKLGGRQKRGLLPVPGGESHESPLCLCCRFSSHPSELSIYASSFPLAKRGASLWTADKKQNVQPNLHSYSVTVTNHEAYGVQLRGSLI